MKYFKNINMDKYDTKSFDFLYDDVMYNYSIKAFLIAIAALLMPNISINLLHIFDYTLFKIVFILFEDIKPC